MGQKCRMWPKMPDLVDFGQKIHFSGEGVKLLVSSYQGTNETPFPCWKHRWVRLQLAARAKNVLFDPKIWIFGAKSQLLYGNHDFCQQGISQVYPGLKLSHSDHPKKIPFSELGVIFRGSPLFLSVSGHSHFRGISTLNFGTFSTKLGGTVWAIKQMTQNDNGPDLGRNYVETAIFTFSRKVVFWPKMGLNPKKHPKFLKRLIFIW